MSSDSCSLCLLLNFKDAGNVAECCYQHVVEITHQVSSYLTTKCQSEDQIECLELLLESLENQCLDLRGLLKIQKRRLETKRQYKEHGKLCHQPDLEASSLTNQCKPSPVQTSPVKRPISDQSPKRKRKKAKKSVSGATFSPPANAEMQTDHNDEVHDQIAKQNAVRKNEHSNNNSSTDPEIPPVGFPALTPAPDLNMSSENVSDIDVSDVDEVTYSQDDPATFDPNFEKTEKKGYSREVGSSFAAADGGENNQLSLDDDNDDDNQLLDADDDDKAMLTPYCWTNQQQFVPAFF